MPPTKTPPAPANVRGARQLATLHGPAVARIRRAMRRAALHRHHAAAVAARIAYRRWWRAVRLWAARNGTTPHAAAPGGPWPTGALPPARWWAAYGYPCGGGGMWPCPGCRRLNLPEHVFCLCGAAYPGPHGGGGPVRAAAGAVLATYHTNP